MDLREEIACKVCGGVVGCSDNPNTEIRWKDAYCKQSLFKADQILALLPDKSREELIKERSQYYYDLYARSDGLDEGAKVEDMSEEATADVDWFLAHRLKAKLPELKYTRSGGDPDYMTGHAKGFAEGWNSAICRMQSLNPGLF
jgi:hypothetical protein